MLHSTGADAEDELAMLRDLKQRFVDGLILVLAADHRGARGRARARGGARDRDRHAAEGHARRHGADEVAARRGRRRAPPARGRPPADRVRQRPAADGAGDGAAARLPRRPALVRARARRGPLRRRRRLHGRARAAAPSSGCSRARGPTRSSAPTTCSRSARSRRCAMRISTCRSDVAVVGMDNTGLSELTWPALTTIDLGSAERARIAAELLFSRIEDPSRAAAVDQRRAAPRRARLVREPGGA